MHLVLIATQDLDVLRDIVTTMPRDTCKPIASRSADGVVEKLQGRTIALAIVHHDIAGTRSLDFCAYLKNALPGVETIFLRDGNAPVVDFPPYPPPSKTLTYPCPRPILRRAITTLLTPDFVPPNDEEQLEMIYSIDQRIEATATQDLYQRLFCELGAKHHQLVASFDRITYEFHPDRYRWIRDVEPYGESIYERITLYYKIIVEAWNILKNRTSRREYDEMLRKQ